MNYCMDPEYTEYTKTQMKNECVETQQSEGGPTSSVNSSSVRTSNHFCVWSVEGPHKHNFLTNFSKTSFFDTYSL